MWFLDFPFISSITLVPFLFFIIMFFYFLFFRQIFCIQISNYSYVLVRSLKFSCMFSFDWLFILIWCFFFTSLHIFSILLVHIIHWTLFSMHSFFFFWVRYYSFKIVLHCYKANILFHPNWTTYIVHGDSAFWFIYGFFFFYSLLHFH